ncbi:MAG: hypothetical protein PHX08_20865 [Lachnospiraceae bacterium]|nr:hypothetical protein [Lachnospiraceae bacterium]
MVRSFMGYQRFASYALFPLKLLFFLLISSIGLLLTSHSSVIFGCLIIIILTRHIFFVPNSNKIYRLCLIMSCSAILLWRVFEGQWISHYALISVRRIWLLLFAGNLFLLSISFDEILLWAKRLRLPNGFVLGVIVALNSFCYFLESFTQIKRAYNSRNYGLTHFIGLGLRLRALCIDAFFLMVECKKVLIIYEKQLLTDIQKVSSNVEN